MCEDLLAVAARAVMIENIRRGTHNWIETEIGIAIETDIAVNVIEKGRGIATMAVIKIVKGNENEKEIGTGIVDVIHIGIEIEREVGRD